MADYIKENNRLLYIEPTLLNDTDETGRSYISPLEDYCIGVDLEMYYTKRDACGYSKNNNRVVKKNVEVSFFNGTDGNLTTNYTDISMTSPWENTTECVGIKNINITYNLDRYPMVTITFTDVRGASLIGPTELKENYGEGDGSFFSMLYSMPSPRFKLKVKGFYGNMVTYDLVMQSSKLNFNAEKGDFDVIVNFIGYMYGIYADLPITYLSLAPFINGSGFPYWEEQVENKRFTFDDGNGNKVPMIPFPELRLAIAEASASPEMQELAENEAKNLKDYNSQVMALRLLLNDFPFKDWDITGNTTYGFVATDNAKYEENIKNAAERFTTTLEGYNERYPDDKLNGFSYVGEILSGSSLEVMTFAKKKDAPYQLQKANARYGTLKKNIDKVIKNRFTDTAVSKFYVLSFPNRMQTNGMETIKQKLKSVDEAREKQKKEYEAAKRQAITNSLGFPTTIKNLYELIFAHMETFIGAFYHYLDIIIASDAETRNPSHYGMTLDDTDCISDNMPPFPGFYKDIEQKDGSKRRTMIWPGDLTNGSDLPEVDFVNNILVGAHFYAEEEKAINANIEALGKDEEGETKLPNLEEYSLDDNGNNDFKLAIYMTLKSLYDKWICSGDKEQWMLGDSEDSQFNRFLYIDSFYHNIGNKLTVNMEKMSELLARYMPTGFASGTDPNYSLYNFLSEIAQTNGATLMGFPISFGYDRETIKTMFTPQAFNSSIDDDNSTFVVLYPYQYSQILDPIEAMNSGFRGDSFRMVNDDGSWSETLPKSLIDDGNKICSFGVSYGRQNQGMFKGLQLNMNAPQVTEAAIEGTMNVVATNGQGIREGVLYGQDIYSNYSNYAFEASMETMGNAQIMPLMYFQLNGVPMWRGTYMISKVSHEIVPGNMTTKFSGYRISENTIPLVGGDLVYMTTSDVKVTSSSGASSTNGGSSSSSKNYNIDGNKVPTTTNHGADRMEECLQDILENLGKVHNKYNLDSCHYCAGAVSRTLRYYYGADLKTALNTGGGNADQVGTFEEGSLTDADGNTLNENFKNTLVKQLGYRVSWHEWMDSSLFPCNYAGNSNLILNKLKDANQSIDVGDVIVYYGIKNRKVVKRHAVLYKGVPSDNVIADAPANIKSEVKKRVWASDFRQGSLFVYGGSANKADKWLTVLFKHP